MTIDEAIEHCMDIAETQEMCSNGKKCAEEHRQLAEWLKDYKRQTDMLDKMRAEIMSLDYIDEDKYEGISIDPQISRDDVLYIIDKYKAESEVQDADSD
jgi:hypothetical protein